MTRICVSLGSILLAILVWPIEEFFLRNPPTKEPRRIFQYCWVFGGFPLQRRHLSRIRQPSRIDFLAGPFAAESMPADAVERFGYKAGGLGKQCRHRTPIVRPIKETGAAAGYGEPGFRLAIA